MAPLEIKSATFRPVAQCLNQLPRSLPDQLCISLQGRAGKDSHPIGRKSCPYACHEGILRSEGTAPHIRGI